MLPCREEAGRRREVALSAVVESPVRGRVYGETLAGSWALDKGHFYDNTPTSDSACENGNDWHQHSRQYDTHFVSTGSGSGTGGSIAYKQHISTLHATWVFIKSGYLYIIQYIVSECMCICLR